MIYLILYAIGAVATYGWAWALARHHIRGDRTDRLICGVCSLLWPLFVPLFGYGSYRDESRVWRGWRLR